MKHYLEVPYYGFPVEILQVLLMNKVLHLWERWHICAHLLKSTNF